MKTKTRSGISVCDEAVAKEEKVKIFGLLTQFRLKEPQKFG